MYKIHFEFNQVGIDFLSKQVMKEFYNFLNQIDGKKYEKQNGSSSYKRKIHIPFPNSTIKILLSPTELEDLKYLFKTFLYSTNFEQHTNELTQKLAQLTNTNFN